MKKNWKATYTSKILNTRSYIKPINTISDGEGVIRLERFFVYAVVFLFGAFIASMILRPDLIDWNTFSRSFMNGVIFSTIMR